MTDRDILSAALPSYEIGEQLGRGSFGVVYSGVHRQLGRQVAIKQLTTDFGADSSGREKFLSEARVLASMDHPHIVPIFDFVEHEGTCLLVMERLTGGTLWNRMSSGDVDDRFACAAALAVAAGLEYAHRRRVLHRDIKPDNLMFSADGVLKVTDFGIAKVIGGALSTATRAGLAMGTPAYMAPEQALGEPVGAATDVYALGTVLYEMMAGQLPYPEPTDPVASLYRHVHEEPLPIAQVAPTVPRPIASVIDRAIARSLDVRYPTAAAFQSGLNEAVIQAWGPGWATTPVLQLHDVAPLPRPSRETPTVVDPPVAETTREPVGPPTIAQASTTQPGAPPPPATPTGAPPPTPTSPVPLSTPRRGGWMVPALVGGAAVAVIALVVVVLATRGSGSHAPTPVASVATTAAPATHAGARLAVFPQATCTDQSVGPNNLGTPIDFFQYDFHGQPRGITMCSGSGGALTLSLPSCPTANCNAVRAAATAGGGQYHVGPDGAGHLYTLDGAAFIVKDTSGAVLEAFTVTESSRPPGNVGSIGVYMAMEDYLQISAQSRAVATGLSNGISNCSLSAVQATDAITTVDTGRTEVLAAMQKLEAAHPATGAPTAQFITALNDSLQSDLAWARWIKAQWVPYATAGCTGQVAQTGNADFDTFMQLSTQATQDKAAFLTAFNSQAATAHLESDWTPDKI
jgi:serine/threonine protein kinase